MMGAGDMSMKGLNFMKPLTKPAVEVVKGPLEVMGNMGGIVLIFIGIALIFVAITAMVS